ncbi:hypothetical protein GOP47_0015682 [Adiantum capillus-veneris]|uniref:mitogen-activated protein kinase kinase kinase n=1 Tax=Adiantum capillus-veneris TaxID=13818 RepID=A0A9D4UK65_ADICA|nr:hypothetical protein GOP47_0015682 [Adiantum capillus-veneris]
MFTTPFCDNPYPSRNVDNTRPSPKSRSQADKAIAALLQELPALRQALRFLRGRKQAASHRGLAPPPKNKLAILSPLHALFVSGTQVFTARDATLEVKTSGFYPQGRNTGGKYLITFSSYQMHRFSALFHKRVKDGKHSDTDDDLSSYAHEDSSDGSRSFRSPPRLMRSPGIRGLRTTEDVDQSRFSLSNAADHSSESASMLTSNVRSTSNLSSMYPSNSQLGSPLPSPPRSPVLATQAPSLWPLPSPRQLPKRHEDSERHLNGFPLEHSDTGNTYVIEGETYKSLQSTPSIENLQRYSTPLGPAISSPRVTGKGRGSSGTAARYAMEPSKPNERFLKPAQSQQELRIQKDPWHRTPEQAFYGDTTTEDEFLVGEYSHTSRYSFQNGAASKNIGYSPRDSQAIGSPTMPSPPLSPSAIRNLSPGGWIKGHLLGSGAFGKVYKGIHSETGEFCAIKEVEFVQSDHRSRESAEQLKKEIASLSSLQHPNIVQYKGSELVGDSLYIYLELISGGSLYKLYQEFKKLEEPVIRRYTRQILLGLCYLHGRKFVHRDIKCANILVDQDGTIKLADFGVSKYIKEQGVPFSLKGSPHWMAPEVIMATNTGYEYAVDIWSLGCTVIEMVTGRPPWCDLEAAAAMFKVTKVGAPPIPESLSAEGKSFLRLCLQRNPADRPTASALLEHPFVKIQSDSHHNAVHAFDVVNSMASLSAPSSPRSSYRPAYELKSAQPGPQRGPPVGNVEHSNYPANFPVSPHRRSGKPKAKIPPASPRRSNEFSQTQARPSLSAPVSPKSRHGYGDLYPTRSADILAGYPTPFSASRGT